MIHTLAQIEEREHALLSASSAFRWTACPASARLEDLFPDEQSEFAKEGALAHDFAEKVLAGTFNVLETPWPDSEMEQNVFEYVNYVNKIYEEALKTSKVSPLKEHEVKLDYSKYVIEGFGTADTVIIADGTLHVIDFKYGKGVPVSAYENKQIMLYGVGAYLKYEFLYDIEKVRMHIVQPRLDSFTDYELSVEELLQFADELKGQADLAYSGKGDAIPGDHCQFCRARNLCRARGEKIMELKEIGKDLKLMTDEEIMKIYPHLDTVEKMVKDIKTYMLDQALAGKKWPGLKVVEGKSNRAYADELSVEKALINAGFKEAEFTTRKLFGITEMTKFLGKKQFESLLEKQGLIIKPQGKPTLASVDDKRPEYESENPFEVIEEAI